MSLSGAFNVCGTTNSEHLKCSYVVNNAASSCNFTAIYCCHFLSTETLLVLSMCISQ